MVASNLVLIAGAGGTGRTVLDQLRAQDVPVRAMVRRDGERAAELRALGAEVVVGDLTRPESVAAALEGAGRMYLWDDFDAFRPSYSYPVIYYYVRFRGEVGLPRFTTPNTPASGRCSWLTVICATAA
ncbi:NAD(P)H-binding protein [Nonomuraea turcica]|uniref:NAD(P)H-binding protein n=1 Tax=Nonomuraea sp. G32 TaxID=3067274 RepID=UPI00273B0912|nr:NAD(P)H-binding protein [Nonomuraea sp. G32]MDP4511480.1 NAD(P)H-binding protein [Nonomuraea sp. G32]